MVTLVGWPFDSGDGSLPSEDRWTEWAQFMWSDGVFSDRTTDVFRRSGAMANELEVFGDSSGMQVKVKAGRLNIKGHFGYLAAQTTLTVTTAHATLGRIDTVIAQLDKTGNAINVTVQAGTPAASPAAPGVTQNDTTYEIVLAEIVVAATVTTITAGNVTDKRTWARPRGLGIQGKVGNGTNVFTGEGIKASTHPGTGQYTVTWMEAFDSNYSVHATAQAAGCCIATVQSTTTTGAVINTYDAAGAAVNADWVVISARRSDV